MGKSLRKVTFSSFMNLIEVAKGRIDLQIQNLNIMELRGSKEEIQKEGFVQRLMQIGHVQTSYQVLKHGLELSAE